MFENVKSRHSVFRSESALIPNNTSPTVVGRETELERIASAVRPLARGNHPDNLLIYGPPGVGKTMCVTHVLNELESETRVKQVSINCWQHNTRPSLLSKLLIELGYATPRKGKPVDQLLPLIQEWLDKNRSVAVTLDEFDRLDDAAEVVYDLAQAGEHADNGLGLVLVSNKQPSELTLESRSQSRLNYRSLAFRPYDTDELLEILEYRAERAFQSGAVSDYVLELIADTVADESGDCRQALTMLLRAGRKANQENADTVMPRHVQQERQGLPRQNSSLDKNSVKDQISLDNTT